MFIIRIFASSAAAYAAAMSLALANPEMDRCGHDVTSGPSATSCAQAITVSGDVAPATNDYDAFFLNLIGMPNGCDDVNPASCRHAKMHRPHGH